MMKLINRSKQSPIGRRACDVALAAPQNMAITSGKRQTNYTVEVDGMRSPSKSSTGPQLCRHSNDRRS